MATSRASVVSPRPTVEKCGRHLNARISRVDWWRQFRAYLRVRMATVDQNVMFKLSLLFTISNVFFLKYVWVI